MPTHQAEWTTWLLQAINRVQTAYIRHQDSYLTLNLLLDSLLKLTGSDYGFVGEYVRHDEVDPQICFYHKGDTPWRPEKLTRYSAPVSVRHLIERDDSMLSELLTATMPILHNVLRDRPNRSFVPDQVPAISAFLGLPLLTNDRRVGVIGLSRAAGRFDESIADSLQPLIRTATNVLDARYQQTGRQRAEHALSVGECLRHSILETANDGVIACDDLDRIIEFNPAAEKMLGWKRAEIVGRQVSETLVVPELIDQYKSTRLESIAQGTFVLSGSRIETKLLCKDGSRISVDVSVSSTMINDRPIATAMVRDIGPQIEAMKSHEKALRQLEAANQAKRKFVATMSHEIRTPLNVIRGAMSLLENANLGNGERELLRTMNDSSDILLSLINDVLDFSKIEAETQEPVESQVNPAELIDATIRVMSVRAFRNGTNLCFFVDPEVPVSITIDDGRVRQVIINLVSNAIKYNAGGHVEIRLSLDAGRGLRFEVEDDGPGIAENDQADLFKEFSQAHGKQANEFGGTGLGLAISKRIVDMMAGEIGVDSEPGRGSNFWFTLPLRGAAGLRAGARGELSGLNVLLVGHDRPWRKVVKRQLLAWQINVTCATEESLNDQQWSNVSDAQIDVVLLPAVNRGSAPLPAAVNVMRNQGAKLALLAPSFGLMPAGNEQTYADADAVIALPITHSELLRVLSNVSGRALSGGESEPTGEEVALANQPQHNLRVLLAEDGQANRMVGEALLRHRGFAVHSVANGAEAVDAVQSFPYDVVLMDLSMPEMNGFEATRRIRSLRGPVSEIPVIAITAHAFSGTRESCLEAGMDDYLSKPIDVDELQRAIDKATRPDVCAEEETQGSDLPLRDIDRGRIDSDAIRQLVNDTSNEVLPQLISAFVTEIRGRAATLSSAIVSQEMPILAQESHVIKSSAGTFGATQVCHLATDLNQACKDERETAAVGIATELVHEIELSTQVYSRTFDLGDS